MFDDWRLAGITELVTLYRALPPTTILDHFWYEPGKREITAHIFDNDPSSPGPDGDVALVTDSLAFTDLSSVTHTFQLGAFIVTSEVPTHTPEPTTMLLFGTGLLALVGLGRRKKK